MIVTIPIEIKSRELHSKLLNFPRPSQRDASNREHGRAHEVKLHNHNLLAHF